MTMAQERHRDGQVDRQTTVTVQVARIVRGMTEVTFMTVSLPLSTVWRRWGTSEARFSHTSDYTTTCIGRSQPIPTAGRPHSGILGTQVSVTDPPTNGVGGRR